MNFFDIRFKEILMGSELRQIKILIGMVNSRILNVEGYTKAERVENKPSINGESTVENAVNISFEEYVSAVSKKRRPVTVSNGNLDGN